MRTKRKRKTTDGPSTKRIKLSPSWEVNARPARVDDKVLQSRYPQVWTLREYLVQALPSSSSTRRNRVKGYHTKAESHYLDTTFVGRIDSSKRVAPDERSREFLEFTQTQFRASRSSIGGTPQENELNNIVDYAIWALFSRAQLQSKAPSNLLCHGYQYVPTASNPDQNFGRIPNVANTRLNVFGRHLRSDPWTEIYSLLGSRANSVLCDLFLDCGIFVHLDQGKDNLLQVCGAPASDLPLIPVKSEVVPTTVEQTPKDGDLEPGLDVSATTKKVNGKGIAPIEGRRVERPRNSIIASSGQVKTPGAITFVRNRILYARPSFNDKGGIRFGMKHVHVMNRYPDLADETQTVHIMKYIFPRQFKLHNVFTSTVDKTETTHAFKDYTFREREILFADRHEVSNRKPTSGRPEGMKIPKRLRGQAVAMVSRLRKLHAGCPYSQLLRHYCPIPDHRKTSASDQRALTTGKGDSILYYATPPSDVSAFCRAVIAKLLPAKCLGAGPEGEGNRKVLSREVDLFVHMRKFESPTLHQVFQGVRIEGIQWLQSPGTSSGLKMCATDRRSRTELLLEFVYYMFDSLLIPLIRSHFYVTESNRHRNQLFYFRHDVWRRVSEPSLVSLQLRMFKNLKAGDLRQARQSHQLGHSQLRLLPKASGARPIMNLRRKIARTKDGKTVLGPNINAKLLPAFSTLNFEKKSQAQRLGSAIFSIGEAHGRLRAFRDNLGDLGSRKLYFAKMDVTSCFDTIPQDEVMQVVSSLLSASQYEIQKHAEVKPAVGGENSLQATKTKWVSTANPARALKSLALLPASESARNTNQTVFVDQPHPRIYSRKIILKLIEEHVQRNVVTMEKRYFKQCKGIPQGSVLSSLLCSFFYGEFEASCLSFLDSKESLLLRLIDDFLLITTNESHARRFVQVMAKGNTRYGISVNSRKSLVNFAMSVSDFKVPRVQEPAAFPYCGISIDMTTLNVSKFRGDKDSQVSNGLTVDWSKKPGTSFRRKCLTALSNQMNVILLDTTLSTRACVSRNLYQNFIECAMKMYRYIRAMPKRKRPTEAMTLATWKELTELAVRMTSGIRSTKFIDEYQCAVSRTQMHWLSAAALEYVLQKKQTGYAGILGWARQTLASCQAGMKMEQRELSRMRREGEAAFQAYQY